MVFVLKVGGSFHVGSGESCARGRELEATGGRVAWATEPVVGTDEGGRLVKPVPPVRLVPGPSFWVSAGLNMATGGRGLCPPGLDEGGW